MMTNKTILSVAISCILWGSVPGVFAEVTTPTTTSEPVTTTSEPVTTTSEPVTTTSEPVTTTPTTTPKPTTTPTTTPKPTTTTPTVEKPKLEDFNLTEADIPTLNMVKVIKLPAKAFGAFSRQNVKDIPAVAFKGVKAAQLTQLTTDGVAGLKPEQVEMIPVAAMVGLKAQQIGALPTTVLQKLPAEYFKNLDPAELKLLSAKEAGKVLMNLDATQIKPQDVQDRLPEGWSVDNNGNLIPPAGTALVLPTKTSIKFDSTVKISVPTGLPDLNKPFILGGQTDTTSTATVLNGLNDSLKTAGYQDFSIKQEDGGTLTVEGTGTSTGVTFTFMPEAEGVVQAAADTSTGLAQNETGHFVLTTPNKQQVKVIAAPKYPKEVAETLGAAGTLRVDKRGVAILEARQDEASPKQVRAVVFDPIVMQATSGKAAGLHLTENTGEIVYADGTAQKIMPTIPLPDKFIDKAKKMEGVEDVRLNADGTVAVQYNGMKLKLRVAKFDAQVTPLAEGEKAATNVVVQADGTVKYTTQDGTDQLDVILNIIE